MYCSLLPAPAFTQERFEAHWQAAGRRAFLQGLSKVFYHKLLFEQLHCPTDFCILYYKSCIISYLNYSVRETTPPLLTLLRFVSFCIRFEIYLRPPFPLAPISSFRFLTGPFKGTSDRGWVNVLLSTAKFVRALNDLQTIAISQPFDRLHVPFGSFLLLNSFGSGTVARVGKQTHRNRNRQYHGWQKANASQTGLVTTGISWDCKTNESNCVDRGIYRMSWECVISDVVRCTREVDWI